MPITATAAKGVINIALEATNGEQLLLATTAVSPTMTGITVPASLAGTRLHIKIINWGTSGTLTINGTGNPNNTETVNVASQTVQQVQSAQMASFEYVSTSAYTVVTNITTTGLTNALITVYGIQSGKFQLPSTMKSKRTPKTYSPNEHNSLIERDKKILQLTNETSIDEVKQDVYGDLSLWWPYMMMGAPTSVTTVPASPVSLFAATALSETQTLTTQPTAPGMKLIIAITAFTTPGSITINGTSYGQAVNETIIVSANGTYYSSNVYSSVASVSNTGVVGTMAITGVYGWQLSFLSSGNKYSAAIEWFDGTGSWTHPFSFATEGDFDIKVATEATITIKGKAQDKLPIGDRTTSPLSGINRISSLGTNLSDLPMVGWQTAVYMDPITGSPLTTQYGDMQELKVSLKVPDEDSYTFTNSQNFNRVYAGKREATADCTLLFNDMYQWEQFRQNLKQYLSFQFLGQYLGTAAGNAFYESWTWVLPVRSDGDFEPTSDPSKGTVTAKAMWRCEYDQGIGGSYKLVVITRMPPTYAS
ncbi:MAG TPA: hypothetical protein VL443_08315 [Cyclobacteriaceae bacterium]|jgi:hypothetical protein|nr:hypothetical protein [Cyclobacteriaceae bacterium]